MKKKKKEKKTQQKNQVFHCVHNDTLYVKKLKKQKRGKKKQNCYSEKPMR